MNQARGRLAHLSGGQPAPRNWVTVQKAAECTGLPATFFDERTGASGVWPEGEVWKWFEGRKLVDLEAFYQLVDVAPSIASKRGRRRDSANDQTPCPAPVPTRQG